MKHNTIICHLACAFVALVWGTTFLVSKMLLDICTPVQIIVMRFALAYIALWILCPQWKISLRDEMGFFFMSLFGNTLYYMAENTALTYTYSANVSILVSSAPLATALLLLLVKKGQTAITKKQMTGILVAFVGMILVVLNGHFVLKLSPVGDLLSLAAALCWGVYGIILEKFTDRFSSFFISRKLMFYGGISSLVIMVFQGKPFPLKGMLHPQYLAGILFLGLIGSAACYILWNKAVAGIGLVVTNMYIYAIPFVTLAAGAVLMGEPITVMAVAGAICIAVGMAISAG